MGRPSGLLLTFVGGVSLMALGACGPAAPQTQSASPSPTPAASTARPVGAGGGCICPIGSSIPGCDSATQQLDFANPPTDKLPHTVLGDGPVYWGGQSVWHTAGEIGVVLVDPVVTTPVSVTFTGPSAADTATLDGQRALTVRPVSNEWAYASGVFLPSAAGCWTMHANLRNKSVTVSFTVVGGSPPPG